MRQGFKTQAERVATEQRQLLGIQGTEPLPARLLAASLEVIILGAAEIPHMPDGALNQLHKIDSDGWSAVTICHPACTLIIHNTNHSNRRQESNLMHELAHLLCKHEPAQLTRFDGIPQIFRSYDLDQEEEATWLGACLQLPRVALVWAIRKGMTSSAIASHFNTSDELLRFRRQMTGVDRQIHRR